MKKLISAIVTLAMLASMLCLPVRAEDDIPDVHFPISSSSIYDWDGGKTTLTFANGVMTIKATGSCAVYCNELPSTVSSSVDDYKYVIYKMKTLPDNAKFSVYVAGTEWFSETTHFSNMKRYDADGYTYCIFDITTRKDAYTVWQGGNIKKLRIDGSQPGTYEVHDIYLSAYSPIPSFKSFTINADSDEITENNGSVTLTPSLMLTNGTDIGDYSSLSWEVDSINATVKINDDKSLTLTGQMNGDITATAYCTFDGREYKADYTVHISGQPDRVASKKIKLMTYGNSIHKHGPAPSLGWTGNWGMAASSEDKDYVHQLIRMLGEKYGEENITWVIGTGNGNFEPDLSNGVEGQDWTQYLKGLTECAAAEKPDIITIQYGENTQTGKAGYTGTQNGYRDGLIQFVQMLKKGAPDALVLITTPFWGGAEKINGAKAAAAALNIPIAELAPLTTDENEALDGPDEWAQGVKIHPGDLGMLRIAEEMYKKLNIALTGKDNVVYTIPPVSISITAPSTEITADSGTIQLNAQAEPEGATNDVIWSSSNSDVALVDENGLVTGMSNGETVITAVSRYDDTLSDTVTITVSNQNPLYSVTYDANTTDEVKDMPETDKMKTGVISLEGKYPIRDEYNFVGWSLETDGEVIDSAEITGDTTLYAIWTKAEKWTFDRDGYMEGFDVYNGFNVLVEDGVLRAYETDYSPVNILKIVSPKLNLDPDEYSSLRIKIKNDGFNADTRFKLNLHTTEEDFTFSYPVTVSDYTEYNVDLSGVVGTITGFDFTPTNMDCGVFIDEISFVPSTDTDSFFIKRITPENESCKVQNGRQLKIYLNKRVDMSAFNAITIDNGATLANKTVSDDGKILCAELENLKPAQKYTVTISNLTDMNGNIAKDESITFYSAVPNASVYDNSIDTAGDCDYLRMACVKSELSTDDYVTAPSAGIITLDSEHDLELREDGKRAKLQIGKMYVMSFYIKAVNGGNLSSINIVNGDNRSYLKTGIKPTSEWTKVEFIFKGTSQNASEIQLGTTYTPTIRSNAASAAVSLRKFMIDDIKIEMLPDLTMIDTNFSGETGVNSEIEVMFSDEITDPVCKIGGEACDIISASNNKLVFKPKTELDSGRRYKAEITATDSNGTVNTFEREFKTEHVIKEQSVTVNGNPYTSSSYLTRGEAAVISETLNNSSSKNADVFMFAALYDAKGYMKKTAAKNQSVSPNSSNISVSLDLTDAQAGDTVKVYLWDSAQKTEIYRPAIALKVK